MWRSPAFSFPELQTPAALTLAALCSYTGSGDREGLVLHAKAGMGLALVMCLHVFTDAFLALTVSHGWYVHGVCIAVGPGKRFGGNGVASTQASGAVYIREADTQ
ncbi:hypothetical protein DL89DRAFT_271022 [Linderina pennispora]|uniref:Uncharacterized protein n=1 Tax=Linderina pennispora TaxID=61395 RepID=A0A1Y1VVT2_9FUNG|nr:uncharacterized protein DL89DRAFT_271022 [Linderina pennispora]ORX65380.1 hypothetical protein DL89DRAFT_271022 [Linderina pennispora]